MVFADFLRGRRRELLSAHDLGELEAMVTDLRTLPARKTFISRDQKVTMSTYLIEGFMCRYMDDRQGDRQLVAVHVAGDFVDLHGYPLGHLDHDLATLTACRVALVPHVALDHLVATRPALTKLLWFSTLLDAAMHREWIFRLGRLDAVARVSHFFCEIEAKLRAIGRSDGAHFTLPMTQADLGEACGITPVHMNRMLRELKDRNLLAIHRHDVEIRDLRGLARLGEFDPAYLFLDDQN
ncbi:Crp/Fnr family transcriptional regulator [Sphingobium sp. AP49]|uniref:Crp/Fnr family transcriptional regulator n=1 Tax=Sphingobium sp. AP49 TaxID=1144307 RepID=UPI00026EE575|nr:Crp/Fnr family transcriptional regulator [Sphingobium sp. AP49]WHO41077.1 Crp/Fnr family transcriptional regulator [Sphingobium sp. AP49]